MVNKTFKSHKNDKNLNEGSVNALLGVKRAWQCYGDMVEAAGEVRYDEVPAGFVRNPQQELRRVEKARRPNIRRAGGPSVRMWRPGGLEIRWKSA